MWKRQDRMNEQVRPSAYNDGFFSLSGRFDFANPQPVTYPATNDPFTTQINNLEAYHRAAATEYGSPH